MHQHFRLGNLVVFALVAACTSQSTPQSNVRTSPADRVLMGAGTSYNPTTQDPNALVETLDGSMAARRAQGWHVFQDATAPISLKHADLGKVTVPKFLTWYTGDDFSRLFKGFYSRLSDAEKASGELSAEHQSLPAQILEEQVTNRDFGGWTDELVRAAADQVLAHGASGDAHAFAPQGNLFSPDFITHLMRNFKKVHDCTADVLAEYVPEKETGDPLNFSPCLAAEFPANAVMIKPIVRFLSGVGPASVNVYDSTPDALEKGLLDPTRWRPARSVDPGTLTGDRIYQFKGPDGKVQSVLVGLHIVTKEVRDWVWGTYWWSDLPDTDLGADRPAAIGQQNGPGFANYKMCVATNFEEKDPAPGASFQKSHPDLAATLERIAASMTKFREVGGGSGEEMASHQWCANPHIEGGFSTPTNCVGCHQDAGAANQTGAIVRRGRQNFPGDFAFSFRGFKSMVDRIIGGGSGGVVGPIEPPPEPQPLPPEPEEGTGTAIGTGTGTSRPKT